MIKHHLKTVETIQMSLQQHSFLFGAFFNFLGTFFVGVSTSSSDILSKFIRTFLHIFLSDFTYFLIIPSVFA
jgi:hypothetical protein